MRNLNLIVLITLMLSMIACSRVKKYDVKLPNGSVVLAQDNTDRKFMVGDTVCISAIDAGVWTISNHGNMDDDSSVDSVVRANGTKLYYLATTRIGVIKLQH